MEQATRGIPHPLAVASIAFSYGGQKADLVETLSSYTDGAAAFTQGVRALEHCPTIQFGAVGGGGTTTVHPIRVSRVGQQSAGFSFSVSGTGVAALGAVLSIEAVVFRVGGIVGSVELISSSGPDLPELEHLASIAAARLSS